MKRIIFDVPRWSCFLMREARGLESVDVADPRERRLEDEIFERLYSGEPEPLAERDRDVVLADWATMLHAACDALPDWARLAGECRGDSFAAGTAVEAIMSRLAPRMDELSAEEKAPELRKVLRASCTRASEEVEQQRDAAEGLGAVAFGAMPDSGTGRGEPLPGTASRALMQRLKHDARLRRIAMLAGRFKRVAAQKRRSRVRHGADEIADIALGDDIGRLLPAELAKLRHPKLRPVFLRDLLERQAMQYALRGVESLGKGPIVACLDKSGSMEGESDIWATAVALALLDAAQRERRAFALVCFTASVIYEAIVMPGDALPEAGLFVSCSGGTSIDAAISRGLDVIETHPGQLRQADIVLVTDGASDTERASMLRERAAGLGASILGIGISVERSALDPWCDTIEAVTDLASLEPKVAESLFGG